MSPLYVMATCRRLERLCNEALLETPLDAASGGVRQRLIEMREEAYALGVHAGSHRAEETP